jgi:hypothetical protein
VHTYLRIFGVVFLLAGIYYTVKAVVTGDTRNMGVGKHTKPAFLRHEKPREFWLWLGAITFIRGVVTWALLTA